MVSSSTPAWELLADVILQQQGLLFRLGEGVAPRDFAGVFVDNAEVDRILSQLPGLDGPEGDAVEAVAEATDPIREQAAQLFHRTLSDDSVFSRLIRQTGCSPEEAELVAVLAAVEMDQRRQRLLAYIQDNINLPRLTAPTLERMFGTGGPLKVAPGSTLEQIGFVTREEGPWATAMFSLEARVVWHLKGDDGLDPSLPEGTWVTDAVPEDRSDRFDLLLVSGGDEQARLVTARRRLDARSFLVSSMPAKAAEWRALIREAHVRDAGVIVEVGEELAPSDSRRIESASQLAWALCAAKEQRLESLPRRTWMEIAIESAEASEEEWRDLLDTSPINGYRLTSDQLRLVSQVKESLGSDIHGAVRRLSSGHMRDLAVRVRPTRRWSDLVLPTEQVEQLQELCARYRQRRTVYDEWGFSPSPSSGLVALFAGQSGTGKTLAAEIVANDLGADLYIVDLSGVVSKYIGETEKNLERIFTAAASGNEILFFDEADALFGRRSEVGDAHDRYANIEVAYLLQRLERHEGMVIMATNLQRNMDQAFLRRIHVGVDFPMPDETARAGIWTLSLPDEAPADSVDVGFLARQFKLSGGSIRNAALTAAFLAAEAGHAITMETLIMGVKREYQKLGRLQTEADFDQYFGLVASPLEMVEQ